MRRTLAVLLMAASILPAPALSGAARAEDAPIVVFAAASMKTALDAVAATWKAETGKTMKASYAASSALARQIEQGAPADIFISADLDWMDYLQQRKLIREPTRRSLLGNALVLVTPAANPTPFRIAAGADLGAATGDSRIAVCTVTSCPAGKYAKQALESLGMWQKAEPRLAQADNVRAALTLVARGEARFGIVYATDAKAEPRVKVADAFPESSHPPVVYPVALTATTRNADATAFLTYLQSSVAIRIFEEQGFTVLGK